MPFGGAGTVSGAVESTRTFLVVVVVVERVLSGQSMAIRTSSRGKWWDGGVKPAKPFGWRH
jgi:hypothetical protein